MWGHNVDMSILALLATGTTLPPALHAIGAETQTGQKFSLQASRGVQAKKIRFSSVSGESKQS